MVRPPLLLLLPLPILRLRHRLLLPLLLLKLSRLLRLLWLPWLLWLLRLLRQWWLGFELPEIVAEAAVGVAHGLLLLRSHVAMRQAQQVRRVHL